MSDILTVRPGDVVSLRDGRTLEVTDAPESSAPLEWINRRAYLDYGQEVVTATMPAETIIIGNEFVKGRRMGRVVTDISEVFVVL